MPTHAAAAPRLAGRLRGAFSLALPRLCEVCRGWSATTICGECRGRYAAARARCPRCALPLPAGSACGACLMEPPPWDSCIAAVDYAFPWDRLIAWLKFGARPDLAAPLAAMLADAIHAGPGLLGLDAVVTAVPLGPDRIAERGYNQSWEIARRLADRSGLRADAGLLVRCRDTSSQVGLDRQARAANLRQALLAAPERRAAISGRTVAVVDDVMTTGATAAAAALALRSAGAAAVAIWVVARTDKA